MAQLEGGNLWPAQRKAVENLELSLKQDRPRALIQMATGSGKTFTAVTSAYRLIKLADARRVLFLVDRGNLGRQALKEFQQYVSPDDGRHFHELYNVQHLTSNRVDSVSRVVITTIQRLYSMLQGKELAPEAEEGSQYDTAAAPLAEPVPVGYNARIPIEYFDVIFIDECHRSIYSLWRQVLEYFDAYLIGLTATPSKQTFGFFKKNLVMEYNHEQAVADGVNVDFDVYRIRTRISEQGSTVEAGPYEVIGRRDRETRAFRWERLDDDLSYDAAALDRQVVAQDQIRTVIRTFKERLFTEIFPGRKDVPKTLIYAKDDSHADDIVQIVREEFGRGNDFCEKITYRTTGDTPENLISSFRNSYNPRIVVTVDMIATGTDIKPLEVVMFIRAVKSRNFFEQMKGRGVRVINDTDFQSVTPDAKKKTHFVIVDCVGVCEQKLSETYPLERRRNVPLEKLLNVVGYGNTDAEVLSSIASRLIRLDSAMTALKRVQANLKRYRASVLKAACEGRLVSTEAELSRAEGRDYESADRLLERNQKQPLSETTLPLPDGWCWTTIGQITECLDYMRVPINKKERASRIGAIPYYGANGQVGWIDDYIFDEPLVLVVEDETFTGRVKPFTYKITGKSWVNNHAHVLRPTDAVDVDYLNYSLAFYPFTPLTTGTTGRKKLTKSALISAPYTLPPLAEQQRIVAEVERRLSVVDEIESAIEINLKRAATLRQSILKRAFEGKLVPQDPNDEPASVLLERIRAERQSKQAEAQKKKTPRKGKPKPADETAKLFS